MADGAAGKFAPLVHAPGNPQLPTLPSPSDPVEGLLTLFGTIAGVEFGEIPENVLAVDAAAPGVARGFAQTWLNGLSLTPKPIDFGNITAPKQRTVTIHNTYRDSVDVNTIDLSAVSGVTLISPATPFTVESFGSQDIVFEAGLSGDASFDGDVVFLTTENTLTLRMIGRRVIIFSVVPQKLTMERMTWLTDIITAEGGPEQAINVRATPRSRIQFVIRETDNMRRARLTNQQLGAQYLPQGVQLWWQSRQISAAALAADTVLNASTADMEIVDGSTLSIVLPDKTSLEAEVASFTVSTITLTQQVGTDLPLRTDIMPIKFGVQGRKMAVADFPVTAQDVGVTFDLFEYEDIAALDAAYFDTHPTDGLPIPKAPLYFDGESRKSEILSNQHRLDSLTGPISQSRDEPIGRPGYPVVVFCNSLADQHAWRQFLHYVRGSWRAWYLPTGTQDMTLETDFALGGNTFRILPGDYANLLGNIAPRRDLKITIAGVDYYRRISSIVDNGTYELVTIDSVIPGVGTVSAADFGCQWLTLSRIVADVATFRHTRRGHAELRFSVRGVIDGV